MIRFWQGRVAASEEEFERALEHARRAGDHRQEGEILRRMAMVVDVGPATPEDGIRRLERVLGEAGGDRRVEIGVNRARAELEAMRGRFDAARELIVRGKALARELGDLVALAAVLRHSGTVEMRAGDPVAAEREARAGYEILERANDLGHLASSAPDLGDAVYAQGRYDEALALAEFARRITIAGDVDAEVRSGQLRAKVLARLGRYDEAEVAAHPGGSPDRGHRLPRPARSCHGGTGRGAPPSGARGGRGLFAPRGPRPVSAEGQRGRARSNGVLARRARGLNASPGFSVRSSISSRSQAIDPARSGGAVRSTLRW